ncbi:MAG: hypothetical protein ACJ76F_14260 [Bacteroidia bacterium]
MKQLPKYFFFLLLAGLIFPGCLKKESYPNEPVIEFKSFQAYDSYNALLVYKFTDGDGDIGLKADENLTLTGADSTYYYNLYIQVLHKDNTGQFVYSLIPYTQTIQTDSGLVTLTKIDSGLIRQRIQYVENTNKNKALKGEIYVDLKNGYRQSTSHKTLKYRFYMYDRSKNKSNVVESPELSAP